MKKEVNLYQVNVSTRGPWNIQRTKTGRGCWVVAETSPQKAEETVRAYLKEYNLFGNIYPAWKIASETPFGRGTVLRKEDYLAFLESNKEPKYVFTPVRTKAGEKSRHSIHPGETDRNRQVFGAFQMPLEVERIEDCGQLHNIEGVTYEGQELEDYDLELD